MSTTTTTTTATLKTISTIKTITTDAVVASYFPAHTEIWVGQQSLGKMERKLFVLRSFEIPGSILDNYVENRFNFNII